MERYIWRDGKIRLRLDGNDLSVLGLDPEKVARWDETAEATLRRFVSEQQERGLLPAGELIAEVFPGRSGAVLQIGAVRENACYYLKSTDEMLCVFPLAKSCGARLYRRLDGRGYYLTANAEKPQFLEFARPCRVREGVLKERCRRIL